MTNNNAIIPEEKTKDKSGVEMPRFDDYADYVMCLKVQEGCAESTLKKNNDMLTRINDVIGDLPLDKIQETHLNAFYEQLNRRGERDLTGKAVARPDLRRVMKLRRLSGEEVARRAGVSATTVSAMLNGRSVESRSALLVAHNLGKLLPELFDVNYIYRKLAPKTILEYHRLIYMILEYAVNENYVSENVAKNASPPADREKPLSFLEESELSEMLKALRHAPLKWQAAVRIVLDTGCTRGELVSLTCGNVDLFEKKLYITADVCRKYDNSFAVKRLPDEKVRKVQFSEETKMLLEALGVGNNDGDAYVFAQDNGNWMHPDSLTKWLTKFSQANDLPRLNPELLRSTAAVLKIKKSGSRAAAFRILQEQMGYATEVYIEKRYSAVLDELPD